MHHFFVQPTAIKSGRVKFNAEISRQMSRVLRLKPGEKVIVLDNSGEEREVRMEVVSTQLCEGEVIETRKAGGEPSVRITLYLGLTHRDKFEWVLQKCTEVGVAGFVPVVTSRSLVQDIRTVQRKANRWQAIIREAAEQSGRGVLPLLADPLLYSQALDAMRLNDLSLVAWEEEKSAGLRQLLRKAKPGSVGILIGPEGGLSQEEAGQAAQSGIARISLGARILRMETAAVVAAALILHDLGEMD